MSRDPQSDAAHRSLAQIVNDIIGVREALYDATGSALLAGERCHPDDKSIIYGKLCSANNVLWGVVEELQSLPSLPSETAPQPESAARVSEDTARIVALQNAVAAKQAHIDRLMLEYCPDEMTPLQIDEWKKHQMAVTPEAEAALDAAVRRTVGDSES